MDPVNEQWWLWFIKVFYDLLSYSIVSISYQFFEYYIVICNDNFWVWRKYLRSFILGISKVELIYAVDLHPYFVVVNMHHIAQKDIIVIIVINCTTFSSVVHGSDTTCSKYSNNSSYVIMTGSSPPDMETRATDTCDPPDITDTWRDWLLRHVAVILS